MSATFGCPHCGATYPVKPVLVGRAVRCTTCKNAFRLRPDGIADKVEQPAPSPAPAEAAAPPPPPPPPPEPVTPPPAPKAPAKAPERTNGEAQLPAAQASSQTTVAVAPAKGPTVRLARTQRIGKEQEEARRAMAANLSTIAEKALQSETVKKGDSERMAKAKSDRKRTEGEGRVGDIGPAVLSGYGASEQRNSRLWMLGCGGLLALVAGIFWLMTWSSAPRKGLEHFTEPVPAKRNGYVERVIAIQERAWLPGVPPMIDMRDAHLGGVRTVNLAGAATVFSETLKGRINLVSIPVWGTAEQEPQIRKQWNPAQDPRTNIERLKKAGLDPLDPKEIEQKLVASGCDEAAVAILLLFIRHADKEDAAGARMLDGDVPLTMEICEFTGRRGELLVDRGRAYHAIPVGYRGRMLRFTGKGWPSEWRLLDIQTTRLDEQ